jgi:uncharacterized lipoprotein YddW (UPF0748 family)
MAVLLPLAAQPPKHEVRAAWITAVYGLDWPQTRTTSPEGIRKQQAELIEILDRLKAANFNTVLFQTRTRGDVLYKSAIEPAAYWNVNSDRSKFGLKVGFGFYF